MNAKDILPRELVGLLQDYIQGSYLYIPKRDDALISRKEDTVYKIELEKRNQHIYSKYLEGLSNEKIVKQYHLSLSSIKRIILKNKRESSVVKESLKNVIKEWNLDSSIIQQLYHSTWLVGDNHVMKIYKKKNELERNISISNTLMDMGVPVAKIVPVVNGEFYIEQDGYYYLMTKKLNGNNLSNIREEGLAYKMGEVIGQLHLAFLQCEKSVTFRNANLLDEMKGWIKEEFIRNEWNLLEESSFYEVVDNLSKAYDELPKQLIHRDVHFGNFLFNNGDFSGYIDFDLSQRNIRIFDLCYFLLGLLTKDAGHNLSLSEWLDIINEVLDGYESNIQLSNTEKQAIPYVMESIEILFAAYFLGKEDMACTQDAIRIYQYVLKNEGEILGAIL